MMFTILGALLWTMIVAFVAVVIVYDALALQRREPTVSYRILAAARERPIVAALMGAIAAGLLCHFFWANGPP